MWIYVYLIAASIIMFCLLRATAPKNTSDGEMLLAGFFIALAGFILPIVVFFLLIYCIGFFASKL